jgi:hypothetical protein
MVSNGVVTTPNTISQPIYQYGSVGTYVIAYTRLATGTTTIVPGTTVAGSTLKYYDATAPNTYTVFNLAYHTSDFKPIILEGAVPNALASLSLSGTWRVLTYIENNSSVFPLELPGLFVRIV